MRSLVVLTLLAALLLGCKPAPEKATHTAGPAAPAAPVDPWMLITLDAQDPEPALLWNGLIGVRIGRDGSGKGGFFAIDEYETTREEKIRTLWNPLSATFKVGDVELDPAKGSGYEQSLDMATGMLQTKWEQEVGGGKLTIDVRTAIHPEKRILADRWTFTSTSPMVIEGTLPTDVKWREIMNPAGAGSELKVEMGFAPSEMKMLGQYRASGGATPDGRGSQMGARDLEFTFLGACGDGRPATFERMLSFGLSPNSLEMLGARGIQISYASERSFEPAPVPKFEEVTRACREIWAERWQTDIEIDGPKEDQRAVRSFLFYLRSAIHPDGDMSISPMGLSSQTYNGHVFWDADIWVFPALAFIEPELAKEITDYRLKLCPGASRNGLEWLAAGKPTGTGKAKGVAIIAPHGLSPRELDTIKYPWESSVSGEETVPGPSRFQDHITGSVAWTAHLAARLGIDKPQLVKSLVASAGDFYLQRADPAPSGELEIKGTMSPDEFHTGDNDLYTNLLAQWTLNQGSWAPVVQGRPIRKFKLPRDDKTFLTYDNDALKGYKQAAAVLAIYPLQYPPAEKEAKEMMERFADKVTENGPAMSDSIHALIWARLGEKERAYETWKKGWEPFTDHPLMLFSEKRSRAVTYFTTGAAGCLQTVLYGFLGFRIDEKKQEGAAWATELKTGWLSVKPNLPPAWKSVTFKGARILGKSYDLEFDEAGVRVKPR